MVDEEKEEKVKKEKKVGLAALVGKKVDVRYARQGRFFNTDCKLLAIEPGWITIKREKDGETVSYPTSGIVRIKAIK